jgi:poly-gamma-glutamate synthesis protein (capsule biosynthesis protein)
MIFVGDIALPSRNSILIKNLPEKLSQQNWFGNLEGGIVDNSNEKYKKSRGVFNDIGAVEELQGNYNFRGVALANNHITDLTSVEQTLDYLEKLNIPYCGLGDNLKDASKPLILDDKGTKVIIINFGWEVIQCEIATGNKAGVNPLQKEHVLRVLRNIVAKNPDAKIVPYMHWGYELEAEPQPYERELAKKMIDTGADGVIGTHPHRIGGFEVYKNKPIVYSLGNWLFKQKYFFNGQLSFPDFCNLEVAFDWDLKENIYRFHFFNYDRDKSELYYLNTEDKNSLTMLKHTPFLNLSDKEYSKWYKKNHFHRNKYLPAYYWDDSDFTVKMKNRWNKTRDFLLKSLLNKGK